MKYREGTTEYFKRFKELDTNSWHQFQKELMDSNWQILNIGRTKNDSH